jgi:hypothetical protein
MSPPLRLDHQNVSAAFVALSVIVPTVVASHARADAPSRPARVDYEAPTSCPDARAFEGQVRARSSRIVLRADAATSVRVRIGARAGRFEGDVVIVETGGGPTQQRHVEGSCADVVAALSLIAALALDPTASTSPTPTAAPAPTEAASAKPEEAKPPAAAPTAPPSKAAERAAPASDELPPEAQLAKHDWRWSIGAGAGVTGGVATALLVSVPVFVDVAQVSRGLVSPAFRLRFERASTDGNQGGASFTWTTGSLDGCPIALATGPIRMWPCVRVVAGTLAATGDVSQARSAGRPWLSAAAVVRGRLSLVGGLFLEVEGEAFAPFVRDRFYLEPDTTVHRATAVAAGGAAAVGASFW